MKSNRHMEFLKRIRLPEENGRESGSIREAQSNQTQKRISQEELELQKELEKRFDELFGTLDED